MTSDIDEVTLSMNRGKTNISVYSLFVTPDLAQKLLESNREDNRKLKPHVVNTYARQMANKQWLVTGEPIQIDTNNKLCNGQHRLNGIIKAPELNPRFKGVDLIIMSGVPANSMTAMDDGYKRTLYNALEIAGKKRAHQADVVRALYCLISLRDCCFTGKHYEANRQTNRYSMTEIVDFLDQLKDFDKVTEHFFKTFKTKEIKRIMSIGTALAMYYLYHDSHEEKVFAIFKTFETGIPFDGLNLKSPTYKSYRKAQRDRELKVRKRPWEHIMLFIWTLTKCLESSEEQYPKQVLWSWNTKNPVIEIADKKLRAV